MAKNIGRGGELFKQLCDPEHLIQSARAAAAVAPFHAPPSLRANRKVAALRSARKRGVTQNMSAVKCCGKNQIRLFWGYKLIYSVYVL